MKLAAYPSYKPSGVEWLGDVPKDWEVSQLRRRALILDCKHRTVPFVDVGIPLASIREVHGFEVDLSTAHQTTEEEYLTLIEGDRCPQLGDIIYSRNASVGDASLVTTTERFCMGQDVCLIRSVLHDPKYLLYLFRSAALIAQVESLVIGSTFRRINVGQIHAFWMCVPDRVEQRQIAAFLDWKTGQIDGLIGKKKELLEKLKEKRLAVITQAVTRGLNPAAPLKDSGIPWLGQVPKHWEVKRLRFAVATLEQGWSPQCDNQPADDDCWGVMKVGCVNGDTFDPLENKALPPELEAKEHYELKPRDIIISRANTKDLLGSAAIVPADVRPKLLLCDKLYRVTTPAEVNEEFLTFYLRTPAARYQYEREATGASNSMQNIGQDTIKNLVMTLPPLDEQKLICLAICKAVVSLDNLIAATESAIDRLTEYRTALITAATTGKIDVRGVKIPSKRPA